MAVLTTFTCDCCGKLKGETNHWFIFRFELNVAGGNQIIILPFDPSIPELPFDKHLCGRECVQITIEQNLPKL